MGDKDQFAVAEKNCPMLCTSLSKGWN